MKRVLRITRHRFWQGLVWSAAVTVLSSCGWQGIANVPVPGGPGSGPDSYRIYVEMPDTLALSGNSRVLVADVFVGRVRAINLNDWVATLTVDLDGDVRLPKNATAKVGQTSLLGSQHVELAAPADPSPQLLEGGDTIPLQNSSAYPTIERTLASFGLVLRGGGLSNLEAVQNEVYNVLTGRADQIREFLNKLDTFTDRLDQQRDDITRAIDSTSRLLAYVSDRSDTLDRVLTEIPPLIEYFARSRGLFEDAIEAVGRISKTGNKTVVDSRPEIDQDLRLLTCPLEQVANASEYLIGSLRWIFTEPFPVDSAPKLIRGDYVNASATIDLTFSTLDNGLLTGTGFSGALRALEQSWGRDPATMIPDVRYHPNPADAPVERGECR